MEVLKAYTDGDMEVTEYTKDGVTVSHTIRVPVRTEPIAPTAPQPSIEERLETIELSAAQTQIQVDYLAFMTELATMKGGEK